MKKRSCNNDNESFITISLIDLNLYRYLMACGNSFTLTLTLTLSYFISFNLFLNPLSFVFSNVSYESTNQEESVFSSLSRDFGNTLGATNGDESSLSENLINGMNSNSSENLDSSENLINGMNSNSSENLINNGTN
jgi:hypothetical protein